MVIRLRKQLTMGLIGVILGIVGWIVTNVQISDGVLMGNYSISPRAFPKFTLLVIFLSGLGLVLQDIGGKDREYVEIDLKAEIPVAVYFLLLIGYYLLFEKVGFILDSILAAWVMLALQRCRKWQYYVIVSLLVFGIFALFKYGFMINLPAGLLSGVL